MLMAGFEVEENKTLMALVIKCIKIVLDRTMEKFRISVVRSAEALVIPDPVGVLKEGEIQLQFGQDGPIDPETKDRIPSLRGKVLVTRHPCMTPIDIRKVEAVTYPELARYTAVIIFSTRGNSPLADLLSGGDYDGDTIRVFWEPKLVEPFINADVEKSKPSISIEDAFEKDTETVREFFERVPFEGREEAIRAKLMLPVHIADNRGIYGKLQRNAAYMHGVASREAEEMAFKFNNCMDGVKLGLLIKKDVLSADRSLFNRTMPDWAGDKKDDSPLKLQPANRDKWLPPCIFDVMWEKGRLMLDILKCELERKQHQSFKPDDDLLSRWKEAVAKNRLSPLQIEVMQNHCATILQMDKSARSEYQQRKNIMSISPQKQTKRTLTDSTSYTSTFSEIQVHYEAWIFDHEKAYEVAGLSMPEERISLVDSLDDGEKERLWYLMASCLYTQACEKVRWGGEREKVALDIAWSSLLTIKAQKVARRDDQLAITVPESTYTLLRQRRPRA